MTWYPDAKSDDSLSQGRAFERFASDLLRERLGWNVDLYESRRFQLEKGESRQGYEFKLDDPCTRTGRLSIEMAEKSRADNADWVPSGIFRDDNTILYVQGNYEVVFVFSKKVLRRWHNCHMKRGDLQTHQERETVRAFYVPIAEAEEVAEVTIRPEKAA